MSTTPRSVFTDTLSLSLGRDPMQRFSTSPTSPNTLASQSWTPAGCSNCRAGTSQTPSTSNKSSEHTQSRSLRPGYLQPSKARGKDLDSRTRSLRDKTVKVKISDYVRRGFDHRKTQVTVADLGLRDPMMRLPVEIVAEIFILCLPDTYPGSSDQLPAKSRAPLLLLNICKHWADVAVSPPALWKNLVFHVRNYGVINEDGILEEVWGGQPVPGFDRNRYKQWYTDRFEDVLSRWLRRAHGQGSLTLACGRLIRHLPGILGRNVHFLHKLTLEHDDDRSPRMKEIVQIFQSLDGPITPCDLRVTVPGLISLVVGSSSLARFVRFLELPAL
ncbi:hypothetical protein B0H13DRAFT_1882710 [Mycena leptocephala]|nr:hypothetical protein B0H13DRAFT_1882710 [Mycena leptocephala]